jgi:hypothetical protein
MLRRTHSCDSLLRAGKIVDTSRKALSPLRSWDDSTIDKRVEPIHFPICRGATHEMLIRDTMPMKQVIHDETPLFEVEALSQRSGESDESRLGVFIRRTEGINSFDEDFSDSGWESDEFNSKESNSEFSVDHSENERLTNPTKYFKKLDDLEQMVLDNSMFQFHTVARSFSSVFEPTRLTTCRMAPLLNHSMATHT